MSRLRHEIEHIKPFATLEEEVFLNLLWTAYILRKRHSEILKKEDLTVTQYNVLRVLRDAEETGLACRQISEHLLTKDADITRLLERLYKRGLVERARAEKDRRVIVSKITKDGLKLLETLDEPVQKRNKSMLGHLGYDLLQQFNSLLILARSGK